MSWVWLVLSEEPIPHAAAGAQLGDRRWLTAWEPGPKPQPGARRADAAIVDPDGPATTVDLQWLPHGREPLYDDHAVQHALRRLAAFPSGPVTTLTRDSSHWCGALIVGDGSPLRTLGPVHRMTVAAGLLSARPQVLHGTQRWSGAPWPSRG